LEPTLNLSKAACSNTATGDCIRDLGVYSVGKGDFDVKINEFRGIPRVNAKQSWGKLLLLLEDRPLWDGLKATEDESNPRILDTISDIVVVRVGSV
jgi:hypothetical protein